MKYKSISNKILELKNADLDLRTRLLKEGKLGDGYNKEMETLHISNAKKLEEIIDRIGYPCFEKVGKEASEAAWLIIQHSISRPEFMRKCLKFLEVAVNKKIANPLHLAYLTDRIAVFEGKTQCYGTQFDWDENGELSPQPFNNQSKVNQLRKEVGLNTLEEQTRIIRNQAKIENQFPPKEADKRKQELENWKKMVGWTK